MANAFLVIAHSDPAMFGRTTRAVGEVGPVFAHIDQRVAIEPFRTVAPAVTFLEERLPIVWGGWNMVDATLRLMQRAVADPQVARVTLMSGLCYPIVSTDALAGDWGGLEWIAANPTTPAEWGDRFTHRRLFHDPIALPQKVANRLSRIIGPRLDADNELGGSGRLRVGSSWWSITREAADIVLAEVARDGSLARFYRKVACPDESFFHTVLGQALSEDRFARETTFVRWIPGGSHPDTLSTDDVREQVAAGRYPFIRKVTSVRLELADLADELRARAGGPLL